MARLAKDKGAYGEGVARFQVKSVMGRALPLRRGKITRRPWLSFLVGLEYKYFQNAVNNWVGRLLGCSLPLSPSHRNYSIGFVSKLKCLVRGHRLVVWVLGELGWVGFKSHSNLWSGLVSGCSVFNCTTLCK